MADEKKYKITSSGMKAKQERLLELKTVLLPEVVERIKEARAQGDLSENAEYSAAKELQGKLQGEIDEIENLLRYAEIVDESQMDRDSVSFGSSVKVYDEEFDEEIIYTIVGSSEADPMNNRISNESPVGAALIGAKPGDRVEFETPGGMMTLLVKEINL